nr:retrovirus-related Pol polyprotein from transposon TNT 1-94 [Tanacetum cinerariifolium]
MGPKKKTIVVTSDPLALIVEKTKVSKSKEKVFVSSDSKGKAISSSADEKIFEDSGFELTGFLDADYAGCKDSFKSTSAIAISCNPVQHSRTKHIAVRYHFIKVHVEKEKIIIDLEDEVMSLIEKEKANSKTSESLKSKGFESSENVSSESKNQTENDCLVVEKESDKEENPKVIAPRMFKLNVSQCVSSISMSKSSCDSKNVEIKLKRKRRKRKSSKQNVKQVNKDVSRANNDFVHFLDLDTFSSVRRPKNSGVIWKKKGSSNTSNVGLFAVGLSAVNVSNLNKNVKRYSHKDLLACNNSHLGETSSASVCNDVMNVSCNSRMNDL